MTSLHIRRSMFLRHAVRSQSLIFTAHFPTLSVTTPTSQLILQPFSPLHLPHSSFSNPFPHFTYVTAYSPTLYFTSPTSQLILQPFRRFTYVTAHSPTLSVTSPTSQLILQPFFRFSYVKGSSLTSTGEPPISQASTDQPLCFEIFIMASHQRVVNIL